METSVPSRLTRNPKRATRPPMGSQSPCWSAGLARFESVAVALCHLMSSQHSSRQNFSRFAWPWSSGRCREGATWYVDVLCRRVFQTSPLPPDCSSLWARL